MIKGNILDLITDEIYPAEINIKNGIITEVKRITGEFEGLIIPGLIDSHIHIESSMLTPSYFAQASVPYGTTAIIADPHEIGNVLGVEGIEFMHNDSKNTPLRTYFSAPSCVPATPFEFSGATLDSKIIGELLKEDYIVALGELMNFPGVIAKDSEVMAKIQKAIDIGKPIDGHAPLLSNEDLVTYVNAGISTDHECSSIEETTEKHNLGMKIMGRNGSVAKNLEDLVGGHIDFLVSDDISAETLVNEGHLDVTIRKAIKLGIDPIEAIKMVTINPAQHYSLNMGAIAVGNYADFIIIDDLKSFNVKSVYIGGVLVAENKEPLFEPSSAYLDNTIDLDFVEPSDFAIEAKGNSAIVRSIGISKDSLLTYEEEVELIIINNEIQTNIEKDVLKIAVVERYGKGKHYSKKLQKNVKGNIATAFIKGFGIKEGAIATSIAHDSHNLIVIGTNDEYMAQAVNQLIKIKGGLITVATNTIKTVKLPIAGLMAAEPAKIIYSKLEELYQLSQEIGLNKDIPFMSLSFISLLVIPELKLSDQGLFNVQKFQFVDLIKEIK